jgi:hypothetical protein
MHFSPARWTAAVAAAALIALPGSALAQTPPRNPPSQPPTQTQPQAQPPASPQASSPAAPQVDATAAKQRLTEARESLSQLTSMPEAAKLQGETRTKVAELISNFNALITTQTDWRASYGKVNESLNALLGPDAEQAGQAVGTAGTGTAGATGTTGTTAAGSASAAPGVQLDPALRAKLVEFRTHLSEFEKAAGGAAPAPAAAPENAPKPENAPNSMPPAAATASTSNPANPATASNPPTNPPPSNPPAAAAAETSGATGTSAAASTGTAAAGTNAVAQSELAAIDAILAKSKTGALTKAQTDELKRHIEALRALLK